jgi:hypothetical protein
VLNPTNPSFRQFYVYRLFANYNRTFFIGIGHWSPGLRWHRPSLGGMPISLLRRNLVGIEPSDWEKVETQVIKRLHFDHNVPIRWEFLTKRNLTFPEAVAREEEIVRQYPQEEGCVLANNKFDPTHPTEDQVVEHVLSSSSGTIQAGWELDFKK